MGSITVSQTKARLPGGYLLSGLACLVLLTVLSCGPGSERAKPSALYLDPSSALQGAILTVNAAATGIDFSQCENLDINAFSSEGPDGTQQITAQSVTLVGEGSIRLNIRVDHDAQVDTHSIFYQCDSNTLLSGELYIRERVGDVQLILSPDTALAGSTDEEITISVAPDGDGGSYFVDGVSHVVFGDGEKVEVKSQAISPTQMKVTVDISASAEGEMDVAVVTGSTVARGVFTIGKRTYSTIQVDPDQVVRPYDQVSQAFDIDITGKDIEFDGDTVVTFPDNPGILVGDVTVASPTALQLEITVYKTALLGPTPLVVTSGELEATTDFTIIPDQDDPAMILYPQQLERGGDTTTLVAQVSNFVVDGSTTAQFAETGCDVEDAVVLSPGTMVIWASVDQAFTGGDALLTLTTGAESVSSTMPVVDLQAPRVTLSQPSSGSILRGQTDGYILEISNGTFSASAALSATERSGVRILSQEVSSNLKRIWGEIQVSEEAPVGPALLVVDDDSGSYQTVLNIDPQGGTPHTTFSPNVVLGGRRTVDLQLEASGYAFGPDASVQLDDPSVAISGWSVLDGGVAEATVEVAPTAREDVVVAYVDVSGQKTAAAYRSLPQARPLASASPTLLERLSSDSTVVVQVDVEGYTFGTVVAQIFDGIGVQVERATVLNGDSADLELELTVAEIGPGGWFGVVLTEGGVQTVVPLQISGTDTLTMGLSPDTVSSAGGEQISLSATLPSAAVLSPIMSRAGTSMDGAYAVIDSIGTNGHADLTFDLSHGASVPAAGVPVYVTGQKGAAVGFVQADDTLPVGIASETSPYGQILDMDQSAFVSVDPGDLPGVVIPSPDITGSANGDACLLADGDLFCQDRSSERPIWLFSSDDTRVFMTPVGDPDGEPIGLSVFPRGEDIDTIDEPNDTSGEAVEVVDDPCGAPYWAWGEISGGCDVDRVEIPATSCDLIVDVIARSAADRPWETPDLSMELLDDLGGSLDFCDDTGPGAPDPSMLLTPSSSSRQIVLSGEVGSAGTYMVNIRRAATIREVCTTSVEAFVELALEPGTDVGAISLARYDDAGTPGPVLALSGTVPSDGVFVIGDAPAVDADFDTAWISAIAEGSNFSVQLMVSGTAVDAIQVSTGTGTGTHGEGSWVENNGEPCYARVAGVDTNDNLYDFIGGWVPTPGG